MFRTVAPILPALVREKELQSVTPLSPPKRGTIFWACFWNPYKDMEHAIARSLCSPKESTVCALCGQTLSLALHENVDIGRILDSAWPSSMHNMDSSANLPTTLDMKVWILDESWTARGHPVMHQLESSGDPSPAAQGEGKCHSHCPK